MERRKKGEKKVRGRKDIKTGERPVGIIVKSNLEKHKELGKKIKRNLGHGN